MPRLSRWGFFVWGTHMPQSKRTKAIHAGIRRSQYGELSEAIYLTQGFAYDSAEQAEARFEDAGPDEYIYARYGNPTVSMFQDRIADIEGAEAAFATASGMAAVSGAILSMVQAGDHVVAARALFGSCLYVLEDICTRFGVDVDFVDGTDLTAWEQALRPDTKLVFFESISNPTLELIDVEAVCKLAHGVGAMVLVDNVFATPIFSRAIEQGVDVVIYSATKHIDGQGRGLAGIVLGSHDYIKKTLEPYMKHTGGAISPFNAWMMVKGLETLDLRVRAQVATAGVLASALEDRGDLANVIFPELPSHPQSDLCAEKFGSGGTVLAVDLGSKPAAFKFLNALQIVTISNNLGDAKSLATHPATTTHQRLTQEQCAVLGITDGLVRFSVGLEDTKDLLSDLFQAIDVALK